MSSSYFHSAPVFIAKYVAQCTLCFVGKLRKDTTIKFYIWGFPKRQFDK